MQTNEPDIGKQERCSGFQLVNGIPSFVDYNIEAESEKRWEQMADEEYYYWLARQAEDDLKINFEPNPDDRDFIRIPGRHRVVFNERIHYARTH